MKNYNQTKLACYLGFITQAIVANFAPLLFLKFHHDYHISLGNIAMISTCFFFTQLLVDLFCARYVDRIGYRICIVVSELSAALGLIGLAFLPDLLPSPFAGILISVVVYAIGSGLIEVLCSPIVEACPFENKEATMSLLHSFYCWGSVGTIAVSTLFFALFGINSWRWLAILLALIPAFNIYNFAVCPIEHLVDENEGMSIKELFSMPLFWVALILMVCSGASELSMSQWASAYAESALGLSKTLGDLAGPCMFAVTMGIARMIFGKYGGRLDLTRFMVGSGILCVICYLMASLSKSPLIGLIGCILCGFSVAIMWPGTISISSAKFPRGGTAMFALLAMAGDMGGSIGPAVVGRITQYADDSIRIGLRVGLVFPCVLLLMLLIIKKSVPAKHK
ncbi:MAG: MFS transporter [Eubacteriales bacterium]|nr:MFS transporter [Eubacteriales bacterium]